MDCLGVWSFLGLSRIASRVRLASVAHGRTVARTLARTRPRDMTWHHDRDAYEPHVTHTHARLRIRITPTFTLRALYFAERGRSSEERTRYGRDNHGDNDKSVQTPTKRKAKDALCTAPDFEHYLVRQASSVGRSERSRVPRDIGAKTFYIITGQIFETEIRHDGRCYLERSVCGAPRTPTHIGRRRRPVPGSTFTIT